MQLNKVMLFGNLGNEPSELRTTSSGTAVINFSLGVNDGFGDRKTTFFCDVTAWGKTAEFVGKYLRKGHGVLVVGRLTEDKWTTPEGQKRSKLKITAEDVQSMPKGSGSSQSNQKREPVSVPRQEQSTASVERMRNEREDDYQDGDDVPF